MRKSPLHMAVTLQLACQGRSRAAIEKENGLPLGWISKTCGRKNQGLHVLCELATVLGVRCSDLMRSVETFTPVEVNHEGM